MSAESASTPPPTTSETSDTTEKSKLNVDKPKRPELAKHDASILDLAFVMDCTGSMGSYIASATDSIRQIVEDIVALEKSDIKLALVEYRDHPPQDTTFITRPHDFTDSVKEMKKWLENCSAEGGGDLPEAVADGLHDALKLSWREKSTKICILISDAPPHGLTSSDSFPNGCPFGIDPLDVVRQMAQKGITLYSVGCEPAISPYKEFFTAIAYTTGGQYIPLRNANLLSKVIVGGAVEEISLEKLLADAEKEVETQRALGITDERLLTEAVEKSLKSKGVKTRQIKLNNSNLERASEDAIKYSKLTSMAELKKEYKSSEAPIVPMGYSAAPMRSYAAPPPLRATRMVKEFLPVRDSPPEVFASASAAPSHEENYSVDDDEINFQQSERLVQKILNRAKYKHNKVESDSNQTNNQLNEKETYITELENKIEMLTQMNLDLKEENNKLKLEIKSMNKQTLLEIASCIFNNFANDTDITCLNIKETKELKEDKIPLSLKQSINEMSLNEAKTTSTVYRKLLTSLFTNLDFLCNSNTSTMLQNEIIIESRDFMKSLRNDFDYRIENEILGNLCAEARRKVWEKDPNLEFVVNGVTYKKKTK